MRGHRLIFCVVARPQFIELDTGREIIRIPILYEDRSVVAIDKPAGWLLVPFNWQQTKRNLQAAISSSIAAGDFWAKSRNLKFLKNVHRLDADTTGVLLLAKSSGAVNTYGDLFESRQMEKKYLAVVYGVPRQKEWRCRARLAPDPQKIGRIIIDERKGKEAETVFRLITSLGNRSLIEAEPYTGRTHQIRVHLLDAGHPVVGDDLYGPDAGQPDSAARKRDPFPLGLRAVELTYFDPFLRKRISIQAPRKAFLERFGIKAGEAALDPPATNNA